MAEWRLSEAAERLRFEINKSFPRRDKRSDGSIGDSKHSSRTSDHNPDKNGWVRAIDIDEDFWGKDGQDPNIANEVVSELLKIARKGDKRLKYIIFEGRIWSATYNWRKLKYDGTNPHNHHIHVSFTPEGDEDNTPFGLYAGLKDDIAATPAAVKKGKGK
jgi:hypothetical protein